MTARTDQGAEPLTNVIKALKAARGLVAAGWIQGKLYDDGCYCVVGAVGAACHNKVNSRVVLDALYSADPAIRLAGGMAPWNDAPDRTQADVLALFDKAIASLESKGEQS